MPYQLTIVEKPTYLHAIVTGQNTMENVIGYLQDLLRECEARQRFNVLIEENLTRTPARNLGRLPGRLGQQRARTRHLQVRRVRRRQRGRRPHEVRRDRREQPRRADQRLRHGRRSGAVAHGTNCADAGGRLRRRSGNSRSANPGRRNSSPATGPPATGRGSSARRRASSAPSSCATARTRCATSRSTAGRASRTGGPSARASPPSTSAWTTPAETLTAREAPLGEYTPAGAATR